MTPWLPSKRFLGADREVSVLEAELRKRGYKFDVEDDALPASPTSS